MKIIKLTNWPNKGINQILPLDVEIVLIRSFKCFGLVVPWQFGSLEKNEKSMNNKKGLSVIFEELKNALRICNVQELDKIVSDDYKGFSLHGTIETKKDILENFSPGIISLSEYLVEEIEFEVFSNIGIISGKGTISGSYNNFEFQHNVLFTDIFKYVNESWKYYKSQTTEIKSA